MGTPQFSVPTLEALIQKENVEVVGVYTQPPKPAGRGYHLQKSPVHELAETHQIPVFTPTSLKMEEEQQKLKSLNADVAIVVAYGLILPKGVLDAPLKGCLNIHASLLPRWRGAAPIQRAIQAGDIKTGVCIMQMDEGLDTGPVLSTHEIPISKHTTGQSLHDDLSFLGAKALVSLLDDYMEDRVTAIPQPTEGITYAHKLKKEEAKIDWHQDAGKIDCQIRAFYPWPGTVTIHGDQTLKIIQANATESAAGRHAPGTVISLNPLQIACQNGAIEIKILQKMGGKPMNSEDFLRGYPLQLNEILI